VLLTFCENTWGFAMGHKQYTAVSLLLVIVILGLVAACGAGRGANSSALSLDPSLGFNASELPALDELNRLPSGTCDHAAVGSGYIQGWPHQRVVPDLQTAVFTPVPGTHPVMAGMAYAMYKFNLAGLTFDDEILLDWSTAPDVENLWLGVSDWETNRWLIVAAGESGRIEVAGLEDYLDDNGDFLVMVLVGGGTEATLNAVTVPGYLFDWGMARHDARHTGQSLFTGPVNCTQGWSTTLYQGSSTFWRPSSPVVSKDGTIYVGSAKECKLYALHTDGSQYWEATLGASGTITATPAVGADGTVYCGGYGYFYALSPTGHQLWSFPAAPGWNLSMNSSPTIGPDGKIYFAGPDNKLYALNPDGTEAWSLSLDQVAGSCPAVAPDGTVYICGVNANCVYSVDPSGTLQWTYSTKGRMQSFPAIGNDGTIYVGSDDCYLYAINPDGSKRWIYRCPSWVSASPAIGQDGTIYVSSRYYVIAFNPTGDRLWQCTINAFGDQAPAIGADGTIYVNSDTMTNVYDVGAIYEITPAGEIRHVNVTGNRYFSSLTLGPNNTLYTMQCTGKLYAFVSGSSEQASIEPQPRTPSPGAQHPGGNLSAFRVRGK
jgi:outer membrane protein assembly factor BamB